jgi:hypothetical protein
MGGYYLGFVPMCKVIYIDGSVDANARNATTIRNKIAESNSHTSTTLLSATTQNNNNYVLIASVSQLVGFMR